MLLDVHKKNYFLFLLQINNTINKKLSKKNLRMVENYHLNILAKES